MRAGKLVILVLTAIMLVLCTLGSAAADIKPIPLDLLEHGTAPKDECWVVPGKEYEDESIHVVLEERSGDSTGNGRVPESGCFL